MERGKRTLSFESRHRDGGTETLFPVRVRSPTPVKRCPRHEPAFDTRHYGKAVGTALIHGAIHPENSNSAVRRKRITLGGHNIYCRLYGNLYTCYNRNIFYWILNNVSKSSRDTDVAADAFNV